MRFNVNLNNRLKLSATSDGEQQKWFYNNYFIKADNKGYESISEALVSEFLQYVKGIDFVDYSLCVIHEGNLDYTGCYSKNVNTDDSRLVSFYRLLQAYIQDLDESLRNLDYIDKYWFVCEELSEITGLDIESYLSTVLTLDYIIFNTDRHLNNIFIQVNLDGSFNPAPILDNGASLMSDLSRFPMSLTYKQCVDRFSTKPFSANPDEQLSLCNSCLKVDLDAFLFNIENKYVDFKYNEFERALKFLEFRLKETYGKLWMKTKCY